jgi:peptidoglycan DL-endopeptidase CwlO
MIVICGAMVASLALPASAATSTRMVKARVPVARVAGAETPSAAHAPLVPRTFGGVGFTGLAKRRPLKASTPRRGAAVSSRSSARAPVSAVSVSGGLLDVASSLTGISYRYGGTTTAGFDCSGYTQYVFDKVGVALPRTAEQQRQATTPVSDPQAGDLVFFGAPAHHVGIYAGNGTMWDSPQSGSSVGLRTDRSERSGGATYGRP